MAGVTKTSLRVKKCEIPQNRIKLNEMMMKIMVKKPDDVTMKNLGHGFSYSHRNSLLSR